MTVFYLLQNALLIRGENILRTVLIVKMGTTLPSLAKRRGDFDDWIKAPLGLDPNRIRVVKTYEGEELPDPQQLSGIVITGSHAMVTDREDWSERTAAWLPYHPARHCWHRIPKILIMLSPSVVQLGVCNFILNLMLI